MTRGTNGKAIDQMYIYTAHLKKTKPTPYQGFQCSHNFKRSRALPLNALINSALHFSALAFFLFAHSIFQKKNLFSFRLFVELLCKLFYIS